MYLKNLDLLESILENSHFTILITEETHLQSLLTLHPTIPIPLNEKNTHDIDSIRNIETLTRTKQTQKTIILLEQADRLTPAAQNAFLKLLEEPNPSISFLFLAATPIPLLPTILSRAQLFYLDSTTASAKPPNPTTLEQARTLVSGHLKTLLPLATILAKNRDEALLVTRTAIAELYKAQLGHPTLPFLTRLKKLLALEDALQKGGHIKLHIINMIQ